MLGTIAILFDAISAQDRAVGGLRARRESPSLSDAEFEILYRKLSGPLFGYIHRMTGDRSLAEDLAQKTFLRLLGATLKTTDEDALKAYLYKIATNLVYDHWRRGTAESTPLDEADEPVESSQPQGLRSDVHKLFAKLEPKERALLWLAHVEGAPHREIAGILGLREGSVRVILFRARKKFAAILEAHGYGATT